VIVPERKPRWLGLVFTYRGSALQRVKLRLLSVFLVACAVTVARDRFGLPHTTLSALPFTLVGFVLGVFLGFRTNTSYDRFWEGRRLWGQLVNESRTFARQAHVFLSNREPESATPADNGTQHSLVERQQQLVRRTVAFVHALRMHLRDGIDWAELGRHLPPAEIEALKAHRNVPIAILQTTGLQLRDAAHAGLLHAYHLPVLDQTLTAMTNIQGGCERIKQTPIPHSYTVLIHSIVALYCFGLPFGLVDTLHNWTPAVVLIVAYAFLGLDAVGDEIEDPFGSDVNDLPLRALSRNIEINLLQAIGEQDLPDPLRPDEHNVLS